MTDVEGGGGDGRARVDEEVAGAADGADPADTVVVVDAEACVEAMAAAVAKA